MLQDAIRGRLPALPPGGMTLAFVDDLAEAHLAALDRGRPGERYLLANGFATRAARSPGPRSTRRDAGASRTLPVSIAKGWRPSAGDVSRDPPSPLLSRGQLHFLLWRARADSSRMPARSSSSTIPWSDGIPRTVRWMLETDRV